ncbi:MAG: iron ABC transporter permease [Propionibacteriaceae bacterium]|nr:iron ABC transporter permease [Propionibacteriaceae bacterium]
MLLLAGAGLAAAIALLPLAYLLVRALEAGLPRVLSIMVRPNTLSLIGRSLLLTVTVTSLCLVLGLGLALLVSRTDLPFRRLLGVAAALPLAIPSYVAAYAWLAAFRPMASFGGAVLVLTACTYPYVYLPAVAALRRANPALEEVARSLGRGTWWTAWTVTARQVRGSVTAGGLLVALYVLSDFGAVAILRFDVFTRVIYSSYRASFDRTPAAVLSILLVLITITITVAEARTRRGAAGVSDDAPARAPGRWLLGRWRWLAAGLTGLVVAVAVGFPICSMGYWILRSQQSGIDWERLGSSASATLQVALAGALLTTLLALPVGILAARHRSKATSMLEHAAYAGHGLPGIVVGLSLVFFGVRFARPLYQEVPMLVIAYAALFLPIAVGSIRASVAMSSPRLEQVARSLGRSPWQVLTRVTVPLALPGVTAGFALVMLTCMKELPATLLLRPTGLNTLATSLWTQTDVVAYGRAAPYAAVLVLLGILPAWHLMRIYLFDRSEALG